jgi:DNA polymerase III epsilon subunit-like protein
MLKTICVNDFETDGTNPETCNPIEVACVMIDPFTLDIIPGSEFSSDMRPEGIDDLDTYLTEERISTIKWHCKLRNCTQEQLLEKWKNSPLPEVVWNLYVQHVEKYNKGKTQYDAPIASGINIINFDLVITKRLNEKYKIKRLYNHEIIDLRHIVHMLLVWDTGLKSRSMDSLREYFGMAKSAAHTAIADVHDEAMIISRCLKYFKSGFRKDKFRNCFKEEE